MTAKEYTPEERQSVIKLPCGIFSPLLEQTVPLTLYNHFPANPPKKSAPQELQTIG